MTIRLLHTADWQIGSKFANFDPQDASALFEIRFKAVEKIADYAKENSIDAILVAGDVFDAQMVSDRTIRRMFNAMSLYQGPWILISGNHDAALAESVWERAKYLDCIPTNVYLALERRIILLEELSLAILPAPLTQRHTTLDATQWFDNAIIPENYFAVGIAHGSVRGVLNYDGMNNLIDIDRQAIRDLDYLALGDWHGTYKVNKRCWYSGTPETDRFKNNDSGNVLIVEINANSEPVVRSIKISHYDWLSMEIEILIPADIDKLTQQLEGLQENQLLDIKISGSVSLDLKQKLTNALESANAVARAIKIDDSGLKILPTAQDIENLNLHGYVAQAMQTLQDKNDTEAMLMLAEIVIGVQSEN